MMRRSARRLLGVASVVAAAAGCGSTVPPSSVGVTSTAGASSSTNGLSVPTANGQPGGALEPLTGAASAGSGTHGAAPAPAPASVGAGPGHVAHASVTGPLKIGLAYINNQQASAALGTSDPRTNSVKTVVEAFVRAINAAGGLDGRKLDAVEYEWHSGDGSWSTAAESACAKFTQDAHVSVVLDEAFGTVGGFRDCLQQAGVFDITNQGVGDDVSSGQAPLYAAVGDLTVDRAYASVLTEEMQSGYLSSKNQLGILVEACPENLRAYDRTLLPLIRHLGLAAPKMYTFDCVDSTAGGASQGSAAINNAILRFRQRPTVDRVMFVSTDEAAALLLFGASASSQDYHPGYLLSSNAQAHLATESGSGFTSDQLPQIHGVGNMPYADVSDSAPSAVDKRCMNLLRAASVTPGNYDDTGQAVFSCGPFLLLEAALRRSDGDASADALAHAIAALGTTFSAPGILGGTTRYGATTRDGGYLVQTFGYVASCSCIRYSGKPAVSPSAE